MENLLAILVGLLFAAGIYMLMRRSIVKLAIGLALIGHASTLLIFTVGGLSRSLPAFIQPGETVATGPIADPLPQALILTAIVIGFGLQAFALVLIKRTYDVVGTDDIEKIRSTET